MIMIISVSRQMLEKWFPLKIHFRHSLILKAWHCTSLCNLAYKTTVIYIHSLVFLHKIIQWPRQFAFANSKIRSSETKMMQPTNHHFLKGSFPSYIQLTGHFMIVFLASAWYIRKCSSVYWLQPTDTWQ